MASKPELVYLDGRGLGECIRIALSAAGIDFTERDLTSREEYLALKDGNELLFYQVPILRIDGQNLAQSRAIVRNIGRKANLLGKNEPEISKIDALYEGTRDFNQPFLSIGWATAFDKVDDVKPSVAKYLTIFNKVLKENGSTGYLVGSHITLADVGLLEPVLAVRDYFGEEALKEYPEIEKFFKTMSSLERISRYMKEIRKPKNTPDYIANAKKVLHI